MSEEIKKLEKIRAKLVTAQQERDKLTGKAEAAMEELKDLGYTSVAKANAALKKLGKEADKVSDELSGALADFYEKYPDLVDKDE